MKRCRFGQRRLENPTSREFERKRQLVGLVTTENFGEFIMIRLKVVFRNAARKGEHLIY